MAQLHTLPVGTMVRFAYEQIDKNECRPVVSERFVRIEEQKKNKAGNPYTLCYDFDKGALRSFDSRFVSALEVA